MRKIKFTHDDLFTLELIIEVDDNKLEKCAKFINEFWSDDDERLDLHGSHENAVLKMFAAKCFEEVAFNNFQSESSITRRFNDNEFEGYPSLDVMGIKILELHTWHITDENIELELIA
jgi:hypothetical protein